MNRLCLLTKRNYERATQRAQLTFAKLQHVATGFYSSRMMRVERCLQDAKVAILRKVDNASARVERTIVALDGLSPLKILKRGYFRMQKGDENINSMAVLSVGDEIKVTGGDGSVKAKVTSVELDKE